VAVILKLAKNKNKYI